MLENETDIFEWLKTGKPTLLSHDRYGYWANYVRVPVNDALEYIYSQDSQYDKAFVLEPNDLEFYGIYDTRTQELLPKSFHGYEKKFIVEVNKILNAKVHEDPSTLSIRNVSQTDEQTKREIDNFVNFWAAKQVRADFLTDMKPENIHFESEFSCRFDPLMFVSYLTEGKAYVDQYAAEFFQGNQQYLFKRYIIYATEKERLQKLYDSASPELVAIKSIMTAVKNTSCKIVRVTTNINGKELTFKYEADPLKLDCDTYYPTYRIQAPDRKEFENLYGKNADFHPLDIVKIEYGKRTLYQKPAV